MCNLNYLYLGLDGLSSSIATVLISFIGAIAISFLIWPAIARFIRAPKIRSGVVVVKWSAGIGRSNLKTSHGQIILQGMAMNDSYTLPSLGENVVIKSVETGRLIRAKVVSLNKEAVHFFVRVNSKP